MKERQLKVCYVLSYYSPEYVRTSTLVAALERIEEIELFQARNTTSGPWRYFQTLGRLLYIKLRYNPDCYILGFRGHDIFWPVRLLTLRKFLIFDELMSPSDAIINEGKKMRGGNLVGSLLFLCEKLSLHAANLILTDTNSHKSFLSRFFSLPDAKIATLPVATDEDLFVLPEKPSKNDNSDGFFNLLYYGSFLPLHGIEVILQAAYLLRKESISFTFIGGNQQTRQEFSKKVARFGLDNVKHIHWVDFVDLPEMITNCDLGLGGPFGNTSQAGRVITGKTFQFLAMAKAVIVGRNDADGSFIDKENVLLVSRGDHRALADAILWAYKHQNELVKIGCRGRRLYEGQFSVAKVEQCWREIFYKANHNPSIFSQ